MWMCMPAHAYTLTITEVALGEGPDRSSSFFPFLFVNLFQMFEPVGPPVGNGWGGDPAAGETWDVYVKS